MAIPFWRHGYCTGLVVPSAKLCSKDVLESLRELEGGRREMTGHGCRIFIVACLLFVGWAGAWAYGSA